MDANAKPEIREEKPDPRIGTVVAGRNGKYEILSLIGRGGMSEVYKARNTAVGSIVAVKTLKQDLLSDEELFARFCQEAKAVQMLRHPNIVSVHEFGVTLDGQPFMAMDLLEGQTLGDVIEEYGRVGVKRLLRIFSQVCDALAHAHSHNIIHRDIKPGNIMVMNTANEVDVVKVFDFGFAKFLEKPGRRVQALTQVGDVLGTPLYMSPEQSAGKTLDSRSDIYGVGCVMYEALTGRAPLIGENVLDTMQKQINEMPASIDAARPDLFIPESIKQILFKTLEKDPNQRYQSMADLKRDLEVISASYSGKAMTMDRQLPGLAKLQAYPEEKANRWGGLVRIVVAIAAGGFACWMLINALKPPGAVTSNVDSEPPLTATNEMSSQMVTRPVIPPTVTAPQMPAVPTDPRKAAPVLATVIRMYLDQGLPQQAEASATKLLAINKSLKHTNDKQAAEAYSLSGQVYLALSNWRKADGFLQKALAIQQRELGPTHPEVVATLNALSKAAQGQQDFARADAYAKEALALSQSN